MDIQGKRIKRAFIIPAFMLVVPFIGMLTVEGWNWGWNDFLFAYVIWTVFALVYVRLTRDIGNRNKKIAIGFAVFSVLATIWIILATG